jgi:hypothetical protein
LGKELRDLANSIRSRAAGEREPDKKQNAIEAAPAGGKRWFSFFQKGAGLPKAQTQRILQA